MFIPCLFFVFVFLRLIEKVAPRLSNEPCFTTVIENDRLAAMSSGDLRDKLDCLNIRKPSFSTDHLQ